MSVLMRERKRQQLINFLKSCRARVPPEQVGLPDHDRRRTPGLTRGEVATLVGVSACWYTWLEQGRRIQFSTDALERVCSALRMSADEREYLFSLTHYRPAPPVPGRIDPVSPTITRLLEAFGIPAILMTARWDVIAWNDLTAMIFRDYSKIPPERRNLLRILLIDDDTHQDNPNAYDEMALRVLSNFRVDYSRAGSDPAYERLIAELHESSPSFKHLWRRSELKGTDAIVHYPKLGMTFEHSTFVPEGRPTLRVLVSTPYGEDSVAKVAAVRARVESLRLIESAAARSDRSKPLDVTDEMDSDARAMVA